MNSILHTVDFGCILLFIGTSGRWLRLFWEMDQARNISEDQTRKQMNVPPFVGGIDTSTGSARRPHLEQTGWKYHPPEENSDALN